MNIQRQARERDGNRCVDCGKGESEVALELDHEIPWHVSQDNSLENIRVRCRGCNASKGGRLPGESIADEKARLNALSAEIRSRPEYKERWSRGFQSSLPALLDLIQTSEYRQRYEDGMASIDRSQWRVLMEERNWGKGGPVSVYRRIRGRDSKLRRVAEESFRSEAFALLVCCRQYESAWMDYARKSKPVKRIVRRKYSPRSVEARAKQSESMRASWAARRGRINEGVNA